MRSSMKLQEKLHENTSFMPGRSRLLSTIRLPEFDGHPSTPVRKYREWKKDIETVKILNKLTNEELALTLFSQVTGRTQELLECFEIADVRSDQGLALIWRTLDDAFEQMEHERRIASSPEGSVEE